MLEERIKPLNMKGVQREEVDLQNPIQRKSSYKRTIHWIILRRHKSSRKPAQNETKLTKSSRKRYTLKEFRLDLIRNSIDNWPEPLREAPYRGDILNKLYIL